MVAALDYSSFIAIYFVDVTLGSSETGLLNKLNGFKYSIGLVLFWIVWPSMFPKCAQVKRLNNHK